MTEENILRAAIRKTRTMIESGELTDAQAFALQVLADYADAHLNPLRALALTCLQETFSVRISSDGGIHSV